MLQENYKILIYIYIYIYISTYVSAPVTIFYEQVIFVKTKDTFFQLEDYANKTYIIIHYLLPTFTLTKNICVYQFTNMFNIYIYPIYIQYFGRVIFDYSTR